MLRAQVGIPHHYRQGAVAQWILHLDTGDFDILIAYNNHSCFSKEADESLVVRQVDVSIRVLLTGDCEAVCEQALLWDNGAGIKAAILNVGHHKANAASSLPFLKAVAPETAVISSGVKNQYGHPTKRVLQRLRQVKVRIFRTDGQKYDVETDK